MGVFQRFIERNKEFVKKFRHGDKAMPPAQHVAVLTCMDARIHPEDALGLEIGDAHMIRNAGGRASDDAIRSLVISSALLGTEEFAVMHHTDCGMLTFTNDDLRKKLADERGVELVIGHQSPIYDGSPERFDGRRQIIDHGVGRGDAEQEGPVLHIVKTSVAHHRKEPLSQMDIGANGRKRALKRRFQTIPGRMRGIAIERRHIGFLQSNDSARTG